MSVDVQACSFVCACVFGCVLRSAGPGVGCCFCFRLFVILCEARLTLWGSPLGPRQSRCRIIHLGTKCMITMRKTASSSLAAKSCQACWRGGPPLISCRERLNEGAHSPLYMHREQHNDTDARNDSQAHAVTRVCTCTKRFWLNACRALQKHQLLMIDVYVYVSLF